MEEDHELGLEELAESVEVALAEVVKLRRELHDLRFEVDRHRTLLALIGEKIRGG